MPKPVTDVATFLASCKHARRHELDALRTIVKRAMPKLIEGIKWNAPSFRLPDGDDCITCNLSAKDRVRLIFHRGAKVKDGAAAGRLLAAEHAWLEWPADDRAVATFASSADVAAAKPALARLVRAWVAAVEARDIGR